MNNNNTLDNETKHLMTEFSYDMFSLKHGFNLLSQLIEGRISDEDAIGIYSIIEIMNNFIIKMNGDYGKIQDKLNIER